MMQGNLSGVNITNASGMPGGAVRVSIRGVGSINGSNEPLFVIGGIPVSNSDNSGVNGRFGGSVQNPLSMLNPNDIESIDVLKDAAATAIYGSRATNGVVMVTTKIYGCPLAFLSSLGGDHHNTVGSSRTIDGRCRCILQYVY